ncbi:hypothetical protein [Kocuria marina]|uniref:hypothetical protein n=1 Tax=Kocuria marina TaxID=223184 RepID=UPI00345FA3C5
MENRPDPLSEKIVESRLLGTQTRLRWATDECCRHIGYWIDKNLSKTIDAFGSRQMGIISSNIDMAISRNPRSFSRENNISSIFLENVSGKLIEKMTAAKLPLEKRHLHKVLEGGENQLRPIVIVDNEPLILETTTWLFHRETSIMHAVMSECETNAQGQALEATCKSLLNEWGPHDLSWESGLEIRRHDNKNKDEVDLIASADSTTLIGECKLNRLPENNHSIDATFTEKILEKATDQLDLRVASWDKLKDRDGAATGFIVTLSDYGGAIWQYPRPEDVNPRPKIYGVLPLHTLLLVASVIRNAKEFSRYLNWRAALLSQNFSGFDELEFILAEISGQSGSLPNPDDESISLMQPYELRGSSMLFLSPNHDSQAGSSQEWKEKWRSAIFEASERVGPSFGSFA